MQSEDSRDLWLCTLFHHDGRWIGALVTVKSAPLLAAESDAFWLTMSSALSVCKHIQQPGESRSFSNWDEMRRSRRRLETHGATRSHKCVPRSCVKSQVVIHSLFFYLLHESREHASSGEEIHRETQVVKRRGGGGGWVNACNFLLQFSLV